jgi:hypothetical protein
MSTPPQPLSVPVDAGLTGLGLLIRAIGGVGLMLALIGTVMLPAMGSSASVNAFFWLWAIGAVIRAAIHLNVGDHASRRSPGIVRASLVYLIAAGVHSGLFLAGILSQGGGLPPDALLLLAGFFILSLGWPVSLYLLVRRRVLKAAFDAADSFDTSLVPADRGLGAAGALMLGLAGTTVGAPIHLGLVLLAMPGPHAVSHWLLLLACLVFILRGGYAHRLGLAAHRGHLVLRAFRKGLNTYRGLAILSVATLAIGLLSVADVRRLLGASPLLGFIIIACTLAATWVWPHALGRFAAQLDADDATDGELAEVPPSPDAGALTLGPYLVSMVIMAGGALAMVPKRFGAGLLGDLFGGGELVAVLFAVASVLVSLTLGAVLATLGRGTRAIRPLIVALLGLLAAEVAAGAVSSAEGFMETLGTAIDGTLGLVTTALLLAPIADRARATRGI